MIYAELRKSPGVSAFHIFVVVFDLFYVCLFILQWICFTFSLKEAFIPSFPQRGLFLAGFFKSKSRAVLLISLSTPVSHNQFPSAAVLS